MEQNIINERLERLIPYFRGFMYDHQEELYVRIHVIIPQTWNYKSLVEKKLILDVKPTSNNSSYLITIGLDRKKSVDLPIDILLNEFEEVIIFNKNEEKKQKILREKIRAMQNMSLEDIEKLPVPEITDSEKEELNSMGNILDDPLLKFDTEPIPAIQQEEKKVEFTSLYQTKKSGLQNIEEVIPQSKKKITVDGIEFNEFNENQMYDGYEIVERPAKIEETYEREMDEDGGESRDLGNGITFKPMPNPNLIKNMRDNY